MEVAWTAPLRVRHAGCGEWVEAAVQFRTLRAARAPEPEVLTEVEQSFLEADLDSNGSIDQEEFGR